MPISLLEKPDFHIKSEPVDVVEEVQLGIDKKLRFEIALNGKIMNRLIELLKCRVTTFA